MNDPDGPKNDPHGSKTRARRVRHLPGLHISLLAATTFTACQGPPGETLPSSRVDVEGFLASYLEAIAARDTATLRGMYAQPDRFVWIEEGAVRYGSADEVFASLGQFSRDASIDTELDTLRVAMLAGGAVHAWASFTTTVAGEGGAYSFGGVMSIVLEPSDGGWRIVGGHVSSPPPARAGGPQSGP